MQAIAGVEHMFHRLFLCACVHFGLRVSALEIGCSIGVETSKREKWIPHSNSASGMILEGSSEWTTGPGHLREDIRSNFSRASFEMSVE